jgi:hypothetical protein
MQKKTAQRVSWTPDEDRHLVHLVKQHGKNWAVIAENMKGRVGKQCRERWRNHLDPNINKGEFSEREDAVILKMVEEIGTKWSQIAEHLDRRTENMVKNRYYCNLRPRMEAGESGNTPRKRPPHTFAGPALAAAFKAGETTVGLLGELDLSRIAENANSLEDMMQVWSANNEEVPDEVVDIESEIGVSGEGISLGILEGTKKEEVGLCGLFWCASFLYFFFFCKFSNHATQWPCITLYIHL